MADSPLSTQEDHDRVMALPVYRRWYENRHAWEAAWKRKHRAKADKMRSKAAEKYEAELRRIDEWERSHGEDDAYEAWKVEDDRRYWPLRKA